jgi:chromosomal replication initiator protein
MLHQEIVTPTQRAAKDVRAKLLSLQKPKPKIIPITAHDAPQVVPVLEVKSEPAPIEMPDPEETFVKMADVLAEVCALYGVTKIDILSSRRDAKTVRPRQIAMYLMRHMTLQSFPQISRYLGGRDHTTVLHGVGKITRLLAADEGLATEIATLRKLIEERRLMAFHRAMAAA